MPRGSEAKMRRKNRKKEEEEEVVDMFGSTGEGDMQVIGSHNDELPLPPSMQRKIEAAEQDAAAAAAALPKKKGKKKAEPQLPEGFTGSTSSGIKRTPLILLILMTGTTLLPALIYASDYFSTYLAKNDIMSQVGFRLGIGQVPRKRVTSFYEKHAPEKLDEVPKILAKHYGDYPKLIKRLERKYQDYGYFMEWEQDEAPLRLALEQVHETYRTWVTSYWNKYAPQVLKTAARNVRYNLTFLYKRVTKIWKRKVWPILQPYLGVPDAREAAKQKRQDAAEARKNKARTGGRRKNKDFRDEDDEM